MTRVLVITNNLRQASFRVRIEALIPSLAGHGIECDVQVRPGGMLARRRLLRSAEDYEAVLLQRKLLDPGDARLLRRHARRILFDVDDAVMYHAHEVGRISRWRTARRFAATAGIVDRVVAGNEYLASIFRERGCAVTVLPTVVDPERYLVKSHALSDSPRLVWIGSRSTVGYLREHLPLLRRAAERCPGLRLVTIADASVESSEVLPVDAIEWSAETEAASLLRGDIGIAPTPCDRWTLGKCGFKIIQYMAAGLPVVASPIGANAEIVRQGETGFLPSTPEEWVEAVVRLADNVTLRQTLGIAGRRRIAAEYSIPRAAQVWAGLLCAES
jgi:glycosyltransferase involved in cell wall biosynthesis